ncbi:NAD(P)-binding protein [Lentithecium fluviatile CBS 122367]|uniref:NAD(P)-binding protein n=1 Tax=Lentithecium fluviatile CBS 122367 TaxID=1168545 RepID=A0A6G1IL21_9PLEO|nr:NAD(P)-binding protein [Lentithecium fluviatile CBS 122367]
MASPTPLNGNLALITGASKGIGKATALLLSSLGARVVINYSSDSTAADALVAQIGADKAIAIKADAGNVKELERLVHETVAWGKKKVIANAATTALGMGLEQSTEEEFDRAVGLNVKGPFFLVQKAAPHMRKGGSVVLLSTSLCNLSGITPNYLLYVTTKGAIEQMTRVLAKHLGTKSITVNTVAPGPTGTDLFFEGKSEQLVNTIASWNPFNRLGTPEEIAGAIAFLCGEGGRWVNGQVLRVNGGMTV